MSFLVFSSSAGSGKTYTLVKEYLKIVIQDPGSFRHILAITFTNKSANEMKHRVIESLKILSVQPIPSPGSSKADLLSDLCEELAMPAELVRQRAGNVLSLILHNYSDFAVSTIDSFVYRILRTFAYDVQLPVDFDVELDTDKLIAKAVDLLISKAGTDEQITRLLTDFTEYKASEEYQWQIEGDLQRFALNLIQEDGYEKLNRLRDLTLEDFSRIRDKLILQVKQFEKVLCDQASKMITLITNTGISPASFYQSERGFYRFILRMAEKDFTKLTPGKYVLETVGEGKWYPKTAKDEDRKAIQSIQFDLLRIYTDMIHFIEQHQQHYTLFKLLFQHIYPLALLHEIEKVINEIRVQTGTIHISEFNKRIAAIVLNEPVPFIYERLGEKFRHYLIDEFQDTSVLQWQNLLPLIDNSLASNHSNMIVGDGKQSIYRWRNGEVEQFVRLPRIYKRGPRAADLERERNLIQHFSKYILDTNHRSNEEIVRFNNSFFHFIRNYLPGELMDIYADMEQRSRPDKPGGYVHIDFYDQKDNGESFDEHNCRRVNEIIDELVAEHFPLQQIAILCRSNHDASQLARVLLESGKQVVSSESLLLKNAPEVSFLISVLTFLYRPDPLLELEIIHYLTMNQFLDEHLWSASLLRNEHVKDYDPKLFLSILQQHDWDMIPGDLIRLPIYELAENLIRIFSIDNQRNPFVQFFLDAIFEFSAKSGNNLNEFLDWWEEKRDKLSIISPQGSEAVQIMTIHKSKGLQFPVVIYPYADEGHKMTKRYIWIDIDHPEIPELKAAVLRTTQKLSECGYGDLYEEEHNKSFLDMVNLLYVVMTRASQRLYVITRLPSKSGETPSSVPGFLYKYLNSNELIEEGQTTFETGRKSVGIAPGKNADLPDDQNRDSIDLAYSLISNDWRNRAIINMRALERWDIEQPERNRAWGNLVHSILSEIRTNNDIHRITSRMADAGTINAEEKERLDQLIQNITDHPHLKPFFGEDVTVFTEAEIIHPSGFLNRPDRVVITGDRTVVIDYKTGLPEGDHQKQVLHYGSLLRDMGYKQVEQYLLYLNEEISLIKVN